MMNFTFNVEKIKGRGEDGNPIVEFSPITKKSFILTCDGAGGAGSRQYSKNELSITGAKLASMTLSKIGLSLFQEWENNELEIGSVVEVFKDKVKKEFESLRDQYQSQEIKLKSNLIKEFPATLSLLFIDIKDCGYILNNFWAGDSRNYILTNKGLIQCTKDDLTTDYDPLENIRDDAPMSNLVHGNGEYFINHFEFEHEEKKLIAFSCTDGCFGYYSTPMHFELTLLKMIDQSYDIDNLKDRLIYEFENVSGDDFSMSFICIGFEGFDDVKDYLIQRKKELSLTLEKIDELKAEADSLNTEREKLKHQLDKLRDEVKNHEDKVWKGYKENYLKL